MKNQNNQVNVFETETETENDVDAFIVHKILTYTRHIPNISERVLLLLNLLEKRPWLQANDILRTFSCKPKYEEKDVWLTDDIVKTNLRSKSIMFISRQNKVDGRYYDVTIGSAGKKTLACLKDKFPEFDSKLVQEKLLCWTQNYIQMTRKLGLVPAELIVLHAIGTSKQLFLFELAELLGEPIADFRESNWIRDHYLKSNRRRKSKKLYHLQTKHWPKNSELRLESNPLKNRPPHMLALTSEGKRKFAEIEKILSF
jgi:hypothetical protein